MSKIVTTSKLNRLWQNGILPIKNSLNKINVASLNGSQFATLEEFVIATNTDKGINRTGNMFYFKDTGGWGPKGSADVWYRCIVMHVNPYDDDTMTGVGGSGFMMTDDGTIWSIRITGNKPAGSLNITYKQLGEALTSMISNYDDLMANSMSGYHTDSLAVKEGFETLGGFEPVIDPKSGKITGYKTKVGADTVFPFSSGGGGEKVVRIFGYTYCGDNISVLVKKGTFEKAMFSLTMLHPTYYNPLTWGVKVTNTPPKVYDDTTYERTDVGVIAKTLAPALVELDQYSQYEYIGFNGGGGNYYSTFLIELYGASDELEVIANCYGVDANIFVEMSEYNYVYLESSYFDNRIPTCLTKEVIPMARCSGNIQLSEVSSYPANLSLDEHKDLGYRFIGLYNNQIGSAKGFYKIQLSKQPIEEKAWLVSQSLMATYNSSQTYSADTPAAKAFDSDPATTWTTANVAEKWLGIKTIRPVYVSKVVLDNYEHATQCVSTFKIQYGDGATWNSAVWEDATDIINANPTGDTIVELNVDTPHQYWRISIPDSGIRAVVGLEFYGSDHLLPIASL